MKIIYLIFLIVSSIYSNNCIGGHIDEVAQEIQKIILYDEEKYRYVLLSFRSIEYLYCFINLFEKRLNYYLIDKTKIKLLINFQNKIEKDKINFYIERTKKMIDFEYSNVNRDDLISIEYRS